MNITARTRLNWEETALRLAFNIANYRSEDPYVQVGSCIIKRDHSILLGYNGGPPGVEIDWSDRNERRIRVIHAEENILSEVKWGETKVMAVTALPCEKCIRIIAKKGVKTVIYGGYLDGYNSGLTKKLAKEFGVELKLLTL
jgi:deoxycytidylate deaminase